jgi:hypothetical protein
MKLSKLRLSNNKSFAVDLPAILTSPLISKKSRFSRITTPLFSFLG